MTPYTRLVSNNTEWYLLCTIYRQTEDGSKMIYVMSRNIPMYAVTEDRRGIKIEEVDKIVRRPLSKNNCSFAYKYELIGNRSTGYRLYGDSRYYFSRIQDGLEQLLDKYCSEHMLEAVKEYH